MNAGQAIQCADSLWHIGRRFGGTGQKGTKMAGKYEVFADENGGFRFHLKASNGDIVVTSENYKAKASALRGIEVLRKNAETEKVSDLTVTS